MSTSVSGVGISHHLPGSVDASGLTVTTTQRTEVSHVHAIGAGDKSMKNPFGVVINPSGGGGISYHLSGGVNASGITVTSAQRTEIGHAPAIRVGDKWMYTTFG